MPPLWNSSVTPELAISQARCYSSTASIHHMQAGMNAVLHLGSPCSVHKHKLYCWTPKPHVCGHVYSSLGPSSATKGNMHWHVVAKEPVTDNMNSAGASHFLFLLYRGMEWVDIATVPEEKMIPVKNLAYVWIHLHSTWLVQELKWGRTGWTLQRYHVTIISKKDISEQEQ